MDFPLAGGDLASNGTDGWDGAKLGFSVPPAVSDTMRMSFAGFFPCPDDNPKSFGFVVLGSR